MKKKQGFYWHVYHDTLMDYCYDYDLRVYHIKEFKPRNEIETRLRLFQPVRGKLPEELTIVGQEYFDAWQKHNEENQEYFKTGKYQGYIESVKKCNEAKRKLKKAFEKYREEIELLHAKECPDCVWNGMELVF